MQVKFLSTMLDAHVVLVLASFTLYRFSVSAALRCEYRGPSGLHRSDAGKHRIDPGYITGKWFRWF